MTRRREIRKLCENFAACEKSDILDEIIRPLRPQRDFTLSEEDMALGEDPALLDAVSPVGAWRLSAAIPCFSAPRPYTECLIRGRPVSTWVTKLQVHAEVQGSS